MLGDILRSVIANQPDMTLLEEQQDDARLGWWRRPDPDVVVLSTDNIQRLSSVADSFGRWPRARILVIEVSGRQTVLYELRPYATSLGELSPEQLAESIRGGSAR